MTAIDRNFRSSDSTYAMVPCVLGVPCWQRASPAACIVSSGSLAEGTASDPAGNFSPIQFEEHTMPAQPRVREAGHRPEG